MPQATQTMQDRGAVFQQLSVLPERAPGGLEHASASSLWAACCLSFKIGLTPLPPSLPPAAMPHCEPPLPEAHRSSWASFAVSVQRELCFFL